MSFEAFLHDWGVVETKLRNEKGFDVDDLKKLVQWDHKNYTGDAKHDSFEDGPDDPSDIPDCHRKVWYCRGCDFECSGENYMEERRTHKKKCRYYVETPRTPVFNHHDSNCCCCVVAYHDSKCKGKRKATKSVKRAKRGKKN